MTTQRIEYESQEAWQQAAVEAGFTIELTNTKLGSYRIATEHGRTRGMARRGEPPYLMIEQQA